MTRPERRRTPFTLLEVVISIGILAFFFYACSMVLIVTLKSRNQMIANYKDSKAKAVGWHIVYQDFANAVGVYFLDGTVYRGNPTLRAQAAAKAAAAKGQQPGASAVNAFQRDKAPDLLFEFDAEESGEDPFLSVVVSEGHPSASKHLGFRKVEYFLYRDPDDRSNYLLLRSETPWLPKGLSSIGEEEEVGFDFGPEEDEEDIFENPEYYTVLRNFKDVKVEVYDGEKWEEEWNSVSRGDLPLSIRFTFIDTKSGEEVIRIVPVWISDLPVKEPEEGFFL